MALNVSRRTIITGVPLAFVAAACSSGSETNRSGGTSSSKPLPGGTYRSVATADPPTLDPHRESSFVTHNAINGVYSRLVNFESGPDMYGELQLEGDLAKDWDVSTDGRTWTFHLRQGVKFHDTPPVSGREFVAEDVLATMRRIRELPGHQEYLIDMVDDIQAPDDYTVVFRLSQPLSVFERNMANHFMEILPREGVAGEFNLAQQAIGTGPFALQRWERGSVISYAAHSNYYERGKPYLDAVEDYIVPQQRSRLSAFRTKRVDAITGLSAEREDIQDLIDARPDLELRELQTLVPTMLYINQKVKPFTDLRVRRAVALAIDHAGMMKELTLGEGGVLSGPIPPLLPHALGPEEADKLQPYDPDQAQRLLAEAGHPNGFDTTIVTTTGYGKTVPRAAQWAQRDLEKVGINANIDIQDYATYFTKSWRGMDYEMGFGLQTPMLSTDEILSSQYHSQGSRNWFGINDPKLDRMIEKQRTEADEETRGEQLAEIQRYIIRNISNPVTIYVTGTQIVIAPYVHDYYPTADYGIRYRKDTWLDEDAPGRS